jgi:hypothetical protein
MTSIVEQRYIGGVLANAMRDMRICFDTNRIEPDESSAPPDIAFRVGFSDQEPEAAPHVCQRQRKDPVSPGPRQMRQFPGRQVLV